MTKKKSLWDNSSLQQDIQWDNQVLPNITDEELFSTNWNMHWPKSEMQKKKISATLKGKSFDERVGSSNAMAGRKSRSAKLKDKVRPKEVGQNIAAGRYANGSYDGRSMRGKEHKESTKEAMAIKAKVRQDLKREVGLGKSDKVPKDLLEERYNLLGLK